MVNPCGNPLRPLVRTRFQVYFIPLSGFFSPFPHGTSSLSVIGRIQPYRLVPADSLELFVSRVTQEYKQESSCISRTGPLPSGALLPSSFRYTDIL